MPDTIAGWVRYVNTSNLIITISIAPGMARVGRAGWAEGELGGCLDCTTDAPKRYTRRSTHDDLQAWTLARSG